jgi:hypothetical protein
MPKLKQKKTRPAFKQGLWYLTNKGDFIKFGEGMPQFGKLVQRKVSRNDDLTVTHGRTINRFVRYTYSNAWGIERWTSYIREYLPIEGSDPKPLSQFFAEKLEKILLSDENRANPTSPATTEHLNQLVNHVRREQQRG